MRKLLLVAFIVFLSPCVRAGFLYDSACELDGMLGGNCTDIQEYNEKVDKYNKKVNEINAYEKAAQQQWMNGEITGLEMVKRVIEYHKARIEIDNDDKEYYLYAAQIAKACDAGKTDKDEGLYLLIKKENEVNERVQARRDRKSQ